MTGALSGRPFPATVKNSLGGALAAARAGGTTGPPLIHLAKAAFISGMDLGLLTGAVVAVAGCLVALICLPARSGRKDQLIGTGRGFPLRSRPSAPGRRHAGSPPGQHQRAALEAEHRAHRGPDDQSGPLGHEEAVLYRPAVDTDTHPAQAAGEPDAPDQRLCPPGRWR
jgi:hypothetical protein